MKHFQCKTNHVHHNSHPWEGTSLYRTVLGCLHQVGTQADSGSHVLGTARWPRARGYAQKLHCLQDWPTEVDPNSEISSFTINPNVGRQSPSKPKEAKAVPEFDPFRFLLNMQKTRSGTILACNMLQFSMLQTWKAAQLIEPRGGDRPWRKKRLPEVGRVVQTHHAIPIIWHLLTISSSSQHPRKMLEIWDGLLVWNWIVAKCIRMQPSTKISARMQECKNHEWVLSCFFSWTDCQANLWVTLRSFRSRFCDSRSRHAMEFQSVLAQGNARTYAISLYI